MNTILVTGATGNVGRPLVAQLAAAGVDVRAVTRDPDGAGLPPGVARYRSAHDVEKILQRPATPFATWAADHRQLFTD